jgi:hypothetical protein
MSQKFINTNRFTRLTQIRHCLHKNPVGMNIKDLAAEGYILTLNVSSPLEMPLLFGW